MACWPHFQIDALLCFPFLLEVYLQLSKKKIKEGMICPSSQNAYCTIHVKQIALSYSKIYYYMSIACMFMVFSCQEYGGEV